MNQTWPHIWIAISGPILAIFAAAAPQTLPSWRAERGWLRLILCQTGATLFLFAFALLDHTHPASPPDAYLYGAIVWAVVVAGLLAAWGVQFLRRR